MGKFQSIVTQLDSQIQEFNVVNLMETFFVFGTLEIFQHKTICKFCRVLIVSNLHTSIQVYKAALNSSTRAHHGQQCFVVQLFSEENITLQRPLFFYQVNKFKRDRYLTSKSLFAGRILSQRHIFQKFKFQKEKKSYPEKVFVKLACSRQPLLLF